MQPEDRGLWVITGGRPDLLLMESAPMRRGLFQGEVRINAS